jgi:outer membrane protein OmpA-like peptidoglycan-associated protein
MRSFLNIGAAAAVALVLAAGSAFAGEVTLPAIQFPDNKTITVPFVATDKAPTGAKAEAKVEFAKGQGRVDLKFSNMEPALLFGGDVAAYVLWAVQRDGLYENLGEVVVTKSGASGSNEYSSTMKIFGLMVTAEPFATIRKPSDFVIFTSAPADRTKASSDIFKFSAFRTTPVLVSDIPSLAGRKWTEKAPVALLQAKKAISLADRVNAEKYNAEAMRQAKQSLAQAENSTKNGGSDKVVTDYSRRAVGFAYEGLRDYQKAMDAQAAAEEAARKKAMEMRALSAEDQQRQTQAALLEVEKQKQQVEAAAVVLATDREAIRKERDALAAQLNDALGSIADTRQSARGAVMSLPGVFFDVNKATIKVGAQLTLAKLAGMLQVFKKINLRVEGYTDSTGKAETNMKLSEDRAKSVFDFLSAQGVKEDRMAFKGYGPANPVADNTTADGKAKNRRVEIVLAEGKIAEPEIQK